MTTDERKLRRRKMRIFCSIRYKAAQKGIPFDLTFDELPPVPEFCPVLGLPLKHSNRSNDPNSPSLDRLIPSLGYVSGNIVWMSLRANHLKKNATREELSKLGHWAENQMPS